SLRGAALNMQQTLAMCGELVLRSPPRLIREIKRCCIPQVDDRLRFALQTAETLDIPAGSFSGVSNNVPDDYLEARSFILATLSGGARSDEAARKRVRDFYPGLVGSRRDKLCQVAKEHAPGGPHQRKQVVFFSLCGLLNWGQAVTSANRHTTCGIFARACL